MSLEYARRGLVGMLTPQANTTVEPEFSILWPPGIAMINARLMSDKDTMTARLADYFDTYGAALQQFANAPLNVAAAACTGASYLAGRAREADLLRALAQRHGYPVVTAATAVVDALTALKANRIGLVSPYPPELGRASAAYWRSHGFDVVAMADVTSRQDTFHPIYSMGSARVAQAVRGLERERLDAIVMLGTGMPTLHPIAQVIGWSGTPVMSCNLCLAWRVVEALDGHAPAAATLQVWLRGDGWVERLTARSV